MTARPITSRVALRRPRAIRWARLRPRFGAPEGVVLGLGLAFIAITVWWVIRDKSLPQGDDAKHLSIAFGYLDELRAGHFRQPFLDWNQYPPLVHIVGAVAAWIFGTALQTFWIAENVVFVPVLMAGCYGVGRIVGGRWAGVLACVFALAAPMVISIFHVFMLDGPEAAIVAVSVWALLASDRFARLGICAIAGVLAAAGMYAKGTYLMFIGGLIAVMLMRGGWRNWRGVIVFGAVAAVLAGPWYLNHLHDLHGQTAGALGGGSISWYGAETYPSRWSVANYTWYGWSLVNNQLFLPLTIFFAGGFGCAVVHAVSLWRGRRRDAFARGGWRASYLPELIAGGVACYIGVSLLSLDDPRYTLPGLVYLAVLGSAWIVRVRPRPLRVAATTALVAILALNTFLTNVGAHKYDWLIHLPGAVASPIGQWSLRVASDHGYADISQPHTNGPRERWVSLLQRAHDDGARKIAFQPESLNNGGYNLFQLSLLARAADLQTVAPWLSSQLGPKDVYVERVLPSQVKQHKPCLLSWDKTGIFMFRGNPQPGEPPNYCPPK